MGVDIACCWVLLGAAQCCSVLWLAGVQIAGQMVAEGFEILGVQLAHFHATMRGYTPGQLLGGIAPACVPSCLLAIPSFGACR